MSETIEVRPPRDRDELAQLHQLRWEELRRPLGMPLGSELDETDLDTRHIGAWAGRPAISVGRVVQRGAGVYQIKSMATAPAYRRQGIGRRVLVALVGMARERGATKLYLEARLPAIAFYERCGWQKVGNEFEVAGIGPHYRMVNDPQAID